MLHTEIVVTFDWGVEDPPLHVPRGARCDCEPIDSDDPWGLPSVQAAVHQGYEPAPEAPMWCFLPAIWPATARAWTPDRRVRRMLIQCAGAAPVRVPWSTSDYAEIERDINLFLGEWGIPPRPFGRIWLLRLPARFASLDELLMSREVESVVAEVGVVASPEFVRRIDHELRNHFSQAG